MSPPATLLEAWQHRCTAFSSSVVVPDGCRDLIAVETAGQAARWFVSPLADASYAVKSIAGQTFTGYRLQPGTRIAEPALLAQLQLVEPMDAAQTLSWLEAFTQSDSDTDEALLALACAPSVASAARSLGLVERSLERWVLRQTGRTPVYWRRLARLRRAARAVCSANSLAELAADQGFSDQAHLTREFRHWLGVTPAQVRAQVAWRDLMAQSGYGDTLTGVQISIKNPSRSAT